MSWVRVTDPDALKEGDTIRVTPDVLSFAGRASGVLTLGHAVRSLITLGPEDDPREFVDVEHGWTIAERPHQWLYHVHVRDGQVEVWR